MLLNLTGENSRTRFARIENFKEIDYEKK
jgi:hypothetical protein